MNWTREAMPHRIMYLSAMGPRAVRLSLTVIALSLPTGSCGNSTEDVDTNGNPSSTSGNAEMSATTGASTSDEPATSSVGTSSEASSEGSGTFTTGGVVCSDDPRWLCTVPVVDCENLIFRCGEVVSWYDEDGCLRPECGENDECPEDSTCWSSTDCGECLSPISTCEENVPGSCGCDGDGQCGSRVCVPDDLLATYTCNGK